MAVFKYSFRLVSFHKRLERNLPRMKDLSDAELLAEYAKRKLERNGVCTNGYDFMKGITLGFLVGRVSAILKRFL